MVGQPAITNPQNPSTSIDPPAIRFHAYNEGTIMWPNKVNAAYRISRHNMEFFPSDYASNYVFYFQYGASGPHSYVITGNAGSGYNFIGTSHLQFQWGPCTYAWGRVAAPETTTSKSGCLTPGPRPYLYRCVELQTGRWVAAAQPLRAFRKLGYIDVCDSALQHVLVASAFKVLDMGLPK